MHVCETGIFCSFENLVAGWIVHGSAVLFMFRLREQFVICIRIGILGIYDVVIVHDLSAVDDINSFYHRPRFAE